MLSSNSIDSLENQESLAFSMLGAREIIQMDQDIIHIEQQVQALEISISQNNPGLCFDLSKTLLESVCMTILRDRGKEISRKEDLPDLLKYTLKELELVPENHPNSTKPRDSLKRIANGLENTIRGICELRNDEGFASHGKDGYSFQTLEPLQVHLVARATDAIINFLFKAHKSYFKKLPLERIKYSDNEDFNNSIDENHKSIEILGLKYKPSEVLLATDPDAYFQALMDYFEVLDSEAVEDQLSSKKEQDDYNQGHDSDTPKTSSEYEVEAF